MMRYMISFESSNQRPTIATKIYVQNYLSARGLHTDTCYVTMTRYCHCLTAGAICHLHPATPSPHARLFD